MPNQQFRATAFAVQGLQINFQWIKLRVDTIPSFNDKENCTLEIFWEYCDHLLSTYTNPGNPVYPLCPNSSRESSQAIFCWATKLGLKFKTRIFYWFGAKMLTM